MHLEPVRSMASLFISYSRSDIVVARKLTEAFGGQDLDFWIDWEGIEPTVDWWLAIEKGIEEADTFLFLLSPDSCQSKVCHREIEHDAAFGKLLTAIKTDYEWVQSHRRLQVKALEWERNGHRNASLLRGEDLQEAEQQLVAVVAKEPHPTDLQRE